MNPAPPVIRISLLINGPSLRFVGDVARNLRRCDTPGVAGSTAAWKSSVNENRGYDDAPITTKTCSTARRLSLSPAAVGQLRCRDGSIKAEVIGKGETARRG